jgi:cytoskeletal protein RodZ
MNRFIGLIIMVVAIAALAGAAIGWRFPFLGENRSAQQFGANRSNSTIQPANRTARQQTQQQTAQAPQNTQTTETAQVPDATTAPDTTTAQNQQQTPATDTQPVTALW